MPPHLPLAGPTVTSTVTLRKGTASCATSTAKAMAAGCLITGSGGEPACWLYKFAATVTDMPIYTPQQGLGQCLGVDSPQACT